MHQPPFTISHSIVHLIAEISETQGRLSEQLEQATTLHLRRINRIRSKRVPVLIQHLFNWVASSDKHPLIVSRVFHYEFEFIQPFSDGNGCMGWLWQTLILRQWNPLFAHIPVESLIHEHQAAYYQASTTQCDSATFIALILEMLRDASRISTPQVTPQVKCLLKCQQAKLWRSYGAASELV